VSGKKGGGGQKVGAHLGGKNIRGRRKRREANGKGGVVGVGGVFGLVGRKKKI